MRTQLPQFGASRLLHPEFPESSGKDFSSASLQNADIKNKLWVWKCRLPRALPTARTSTPSFSAGFHADLCQTFGILIKWCLATCLSFSGFWECRYINQRTFCIPQRDFTLEKSTIWHKENSLQI